MPFYKKATISIMRAFIAVDISEPLRAKIAEIQRILPPDAKLVERENLHVTLKFLGKISEDQAVDIKSRMSDIAKQFSPIDLHIRGMGAFPNLSYIRVVWLGCNALAALQKAVNMALPEFPEERETRPHLTIARIRSGKNIANLARFIEENQDIDIGKMAVKEFCLKKSELTPHGPVYEDVGVFGLGKA